MDGLQPLFENNHRWAAECEAQDAGCFERLAAGQRPQYLWIGCADSRVPAEQVVGLAPGGLFVHRNVANQVVHGDMNALAVIQFAVDVLQVRHVLVVGHSGCGGVAAVLAGRRVGVVDHWLGPVHDVHHRHREAIDALDPALRVDALARLNAVEQAVHVCRTAIVQDAWRRDQPVAVHACFFRLHDGRLEDLGFAADAPGVVDAARDRAVEALGEGRGR